MSAEVQRASMKLEELMKALEWSKKDHEEKENAKKAKEAEMSAATKELFEQIGVIQKPYLDWLEAHKLPWMREIWQHMVEGIYQARAELHMAMVKEGTSVKQSADFWLTVFEDMGMTAGSSRLETVEIHGKRTDMQLWRVWDNLFAEKCSEADTVGYIATIGLKIVGFHRTRKSEHKGDQADYYAWIDTENLSPQNMSEIAVPHKYGGTVNRTLRMRDWRKAMEAKEFFNTVLGVDLSIVGNRWEIRKAMT